MLSGLPYEYESQGFIYSELTQSYVLGMFCSIQCYETYADWVQFCFGGNCSRCFMGQCCGIIDTYQIGTLDTNFQNSFLEMIS